MTKVSEKGIEINKRFRNFMKPFMADKGMTASNDITLIRGDNFITMSMRFHRR